MTKPEGERIAVLEAQYIGLSKQMTELQSTMKEVRDAVIQAKAGGRVALGAAAVVGSVATILAQFALSLFLKAKGG